jgi:DNA polymerase Ligase (LigD)
VPRFVILEHDHPFLHWDLMLEIGSALRTWRLAALPSASAPVAAELLGDHRLLYLDYEGPVSRDRGAVRRWDAGNYDALIDVGGSTCFRLQGLRLKGHCSIARRTDGTSELTFTPNEL